MIDRKILNGAVDLHVHAGPSNAKRELDAAQMLLLAQAAGYKAYVVKDHYFPTMMSAKVSADNVGNGATYCFGGIALNSSVGGLNINAVDVAHSMGAKQVWMPTVSTANHIEDHKGLQFAGSGHATIPDGVVNYVDSNNQLISQAKEIIDYIAEKNDMILATGHGTPDEIDAIVTYASKVGVKKLLVNHPYAVVRASFDYVKRWADMGAYIELCACALSPSSVYYGELKKTPEETERFIDQALSEIGPSRLVMDSDCGQKGNGSPVDNLYMLANHFVEKHGATEKDITLMLKTNPAYLLGL